MDIDKKKECIIRAAMFGECPLKECKRHMKLNIQIHI